MKSNISITDIKPHLNYSMKEVEHVLGISTKKLYMLRKAGKINYYMRRVDNQLRIKGSEILKFYNS